MTHDITPLILNVPQVELDDLATRLDRIRWPDASPVADGVRAHRWTRSGRWSTIGAHPTTGGGVRCF